MITFKKFLSEELKSLNEGYKNLFKIDDKKKYAKEAFNQLQKSYEKVGGIHGSGFDTPENLVQKIPFWKLRFDSEKNLIAGAFYKDTKGRKRVAISSDGSAEGKKAVADIMISDLLQGRAYVEQSSASLKFLVKQLGYETLKDHAIPIKDLKQLDLELRDPPKDDSELILHPELKKFFYQRLIGGDWHTKIAFGEIGKEII